MSAVFIALPIALLLALVALAAFVWSVRSGQMDDLETPGVRVLVEEEGEGPSKAIQTAADPESSKWGSR